MLAPEGLLAELKRSMEPRSMVALESRKLVTQAAVLTISFSDIERPLTRCLSSSFSDYLCGYGSEAKLLLGSFLLPKLDDLRKQK